MAPRGRKGPGRKAARECKARRGRAWERRAFRGHKACKGAKARRGRKGLAPKAHREQRGRKAVRAPKATKGARAHPERKGRKGRGPRRRSTCTRGRRQRRTG